jgi:hypothetical protein
VINYYSGSYYYFYCGFWPYYYGMIESYYYGWSCGIYVDYFYGYYYDYSIFSDDAVSIWTSEAANEAGSIDSVTSTESAQQAAESALGVPIGGGPLAEYFGPEGEHGAPDVDKGRETFWLIVWLAKLFPGDVWMEEAPPQAAAPDTIYVTGHKVFGLFGPIHTALAYGYGVLPGGLPLDTISAAPGPVKLVGPWLNKKGQTDGLKDEGANMLLGSVTGTTWPVLAAGDGAYVNNDLLYLAFPFGNTYNSNGYVSGLIQAKFGTSTVNLNQFIGAGNPVPANKF